MILGWAYALDIAAYFIPWVRDLTAGKPVVLVRDGIPDRKQMRRNFVSMDELQAQVREHGVERLSDVRLATLEGDGQLSVVGNGSEGEASTQSPALGA